MSKILVKFLFLTLYTQTLLSADWFAYVTATSPGNIFPINLSTNVAGTPIPPIISGPEYIAITPNAKKAYITSDSSNAAIAVDLTTNTTGSPILLPAPQSGIAITPDGETAYVLTNNAQLYAIDTATDNAVLAFDFFANYGPNNVPAGIVITPDGQNAFAAFRTSAGSLSNLVLRLDLTANPITVVSGTIVLDPFNMAVTPNGEKLYITSLSSGNVFVVDITVSPGVLIATIPTPTPNDVAITSDGATVFVTNSAVDTVTPIDVSTNIPGTPFLIGDGPVGIFITPDHQTGYVANFLGTNVTPFSVDTFILDTPIIITGRPLRIAITPDQAPTASFIATLGIPKMPTFFDASASSSPVGTVVLYQWDFGDGTTATTTEPTIQHTYQSTGNFLVTLQVTNSAGTSTTQTFTGRTVSNNGGPSAITSQRLSIGVLPPENIKVTTKNKFLNKTECALKVTWSASPTQQVVFYRIYRNDNVIATIPATGPFVFKTCLKSCSANGFAIAAVGPNNVESARIPLSK